jgi:hypothetical protein
VLVAEDEAGALQEYRGDLFFTNTVENRESPLYPALATLEKKEGRAQYLPLLLILTGMARSTGHSSSLLRVITRGRRGPPVSRSLLGVLLVLELIFGRR